MCVWARVCARACLNAGRGAWCGRYQHAMDDMNSVRSSCEAHGHRIQFPSRNADSEHKKATQSQNVSPSVESSQHAVGHAYALAPSHARHLRTHVSSHARIFARTKGRDAHRCSGSENERLLSPKFGSGSQVRRKVRAARRPTGARARHQAAAVRVLHGFQEVVGEGELLQPTLSYLSDSLTLEKKGFPARPGGTRDRTRGVRRARGRCLCPCLCLCP